MFGSSRKHRTPVQPLTKETANPNAATAAASAFMRRGSSPSLSSAAAAAALKARPTTPTNVAEVQSKRAVRRSSSVSSTRSQDRGAGRQVRRAPSTGSMSERTFRSPSPGRNPAPQNQDVPPVPSLPRQEPQRPHSSYISPTNIQTQTFRTASQKLKGEQQGSWFGAARGDSANVRTADSVLRGSATQVSEPRAGSISPSINFSYPRARLESPTPHTASASEVVMVYDPNSRRMVPKVERVDLIERQQSVRSASEKPVKKKKQEASRSGSYLSKGTIGRTKAVPLESLQQVPPKSELVQATSQQIPDAAEAPEAPKDPEQVPQPVQSTAPPVSQPQEGQSAIQSSTATDLAADEKTKLDMRVADGATVMPASDSDRVPVLHKKPSTVLEEPEIEDSADAIESISAKDYAAIDAVPLRSTRTTVVPDEPKVASDEQKQLPPLEPVSQHGSVRRARVHSESPARSPGRAHFASTTDRLLVRHEPPPRSLSPRKSALKHSSSVRGASPSDDSSEASAPMSSISRDDAAQARKKAVRVSFNEDCNVVLGESSEPPETDTPIVPSPQTKHKPWHSFMSRNKKDSSAFDGDETMSPRPALPLFGSVREKKAREPDSERPLVRPTERVRSPPPAPDAGPSTDSAIGSILMQESSPRNEANISKTREPLPPIVQSIEGSGYISSSAEGSDDELEGTDAGESTYEVKPIPAAASEVLAEDHADAKIAETRQADQVATENKTIDTAEQSTEAPKAMNGSTVLHAESTPTAVSEMPQTAEQDDNYIPPISVINPTPPVRIEPPDSPEKEYFDVPGGFPVDDYTHKRTSAAKDDKIIPPCKAPHSEPAPDIVDAQPVLPPSPTRAEAAVGGLPMADIVEEVESDHSSLYSDAYEDLSDIGMDGFMSLDAVLEAKPKSQGSKLYEKAVIQSRAQAASDGASVIANENQEPLKSPDDWESAKAYWRSLSVDKRRQLEKEASEEAGEEADQESVSKPKKAKKRRSTDRPASSLATEESTHHPDRTYQIQPGATWTQEEAQPLSLSEGSKEGSAPKGFRKSMRAEQPAKGDNLKPAGVSMRKSLRSNGTSGDAQAPASSRPSSSSRPASYHVGVAVEPPQSTRRALSSDARPISSGSLSTAGMKTSLRRRGSDSSESSFRRTRPNTGEGFGFRKSMRTRSQEPEYLRAQGGSGRFSIRSLSPTGSPFRRSTVASTMGGGRMKTSLRAAPAESRERKRFSTFGRSSGNKAKKDLSRTRFGDSSDDDDGGPSLFASRFAESSDEDDGYRTAPKPRGFAKTMRSNNTVKTVPLTGSVGRSQVRSDSPDLPDSDDDIRQPKRDTLTNARATSMLQRSRSGRGSLTGATPGMPNSPGPIDRPTHHRRGSFMSSILRRKKDSGGKISRDLSESAARRDTNLERSTEQLAVLRSNSGGRPRLQKRGPSWPLPGEEGESSRVDAAPIVQEDQRPATSAGPGGATAPRGFLKRRSLSAQAVPPVPSMPKSQMAEMPPERSQVTEVPPEASLKKKKFGTLRKMFGLND